MDFQSLPPPKTIQPRAQLLSMGLDSRTPFRGMNALSSSADRNDNRFSHQRPAHFTIQSSRTKGVKKTKIGFDADQCGFLHINDIILTISGNLKKTKHRKLSEGSFYSPSKSKVLSSTSLSSSKIARPSVDSTSSMFSESQATKSRLKSIPERLPNPFRKDKLAKDSVSNSVGNFMRSEEKVKKTRHSIDLQLKELDNIGTPQLPLSPVPTPDRQSITSGASKDSLTTSSDLWRDLNTKGISLKPTPSLYEALLRESSPTPEKTTDDERTKSPSAVSTKEVKAAGKFLEKLKKKKSEKKRVTIMEQDGSVYSPESDKDLNPRDLNDTEETGPHPARNQDDLRVSKSKTKDHVAKKKKKISTSSGSEEVEEEEEHLGRLSSAINLNRNTNCGRTQLCFSDVFSCASSSFSPPDGQKCDDSGVPHGWHQSEARLQEKSLEKCHVSELLLLEAQLSRARQQMQELRTENDRLRQEKHAQQTSRTVSGSNSGRRESHQNHNFRLSPAWLHWLAAVLVGVLLGKLIS